MIYEGFEQKPTELNERLSEPLRKRYEELMVDCRKLFPEVPLWWAEACVGSFIRSDESHLITEEDKKVLEEEAKEWAEKLADERAKNASHPNVSETSE